MGRGDVSDLGTLLTGRRRGPRWFRLVRLVPPAKGLGDDLLDVAPSLTDDDESARIGPVVPAVKRPGVRSDRRLDGPGLGQASRCRALAMNQDR